MVEPGERVSVEAFAQHADAMDMHPPLCEVFLRTIERAVNLDEIPTQDQALVIPEHEEQLGRTLDERAIHAALTGGSRQVFQFRRIPEQLRSRKVTF